MYRFMSLKRLVVAEESGDRFVGGETDMSSHRSDSSLSRQIRWHLRRHLIRELRIVQGKVVPDRDHVLAALLEIFAKA
jgi:hypothetical protein